MSQSKARGYFRQAISAQAGQMVRTRHDYDSAIQVANDTILMGKLAAGHRLVVEGCRVIANGVQPACNLDVLVTNPGGADVLLFNDLALAAATFSDNQAVNSAALEGLAVSDVDRDIYILVNTGFATAPAGGKITLVLKQVPSEQ